MKKYSVCKREVWTQIVEVDAASEDEALRAVRNGHGNDVDDTLEYSHDMSTEFWTVDK